MAKKFIKKRKIGIRLDLLNPWTFGNKEFIFFFSFFLIYSFECIFVIYTDYSQISPDPETPPPILTPTTPPNTNNAIYRTCSIPELNSTPFIILKHNIIINI